MHGCQIWYNKPSWCRGELLAVNEMWAGALDGDQFIVPHERSHHLLYIYQSWLDNQPWEEKLFLGIDCPPTHRGGASGEWRIPTAWAYDNAL